MELKNKKGLSGIVVTLITVLLAIVLIGIVWIVISGILSDGSTKAEYSTKFLSAGIKITSAVQSQDSDTISLGLMRLPGSQGVNFDGIKFTFTNSDGDVVSKEYEGNILSSESLTFEDVLKNIEKVEAQVYFVDSEDSNVKHYSDNVLIYEDFEESQVNQPEQDVLVPNVVGMEVTPARLKLESFGLSSSYTQSFSDDVDSGKVISQNPPFGTSVESVSIVTLVVSKGKEPEPSPGVITLFQQSDSFDDIVGIAVNEDFVYVTEFEGRLHQLDGSDISKEIDLSYLEKDFIIRRNGIPTISGESLYIASLNEFLHLNASKISQEISSFTNFYKLFTLSAVSENFVYFGSDTQIIQTNASDVSQKIAEFTTGDWIGSPTVSGEFVYVGSEDKKLYQLNASNVSQKIAEFETNGGIVSAPTVFDGFVYVGNKNGKLYKLNASDISQKIGEFSGGDEIITSPVVSEEFVYFECMDLNLYQLNTSDISQKIAEFNSGCTIGISPVIVGKSLYMGNMCGDLYQLNASDISQKISSQNLEGRIYCPFAVNENFLYVGTTTGYLYQFKV